MKIRNLSINWLILVLIIGSAMYLNDTRRCNSGFLTAKIEWLFHKFKYSV